MVETESLNTVNSLKSFAKNPPMGLGTVVFCRSKESESNAQDTLTNNMDCKISKKFIIVENEGCNFISNFTDINDLPNYSPSPLIQDIVGQIKFYIAHHLGSSFYKKSPEPYVKAFTQLIIMLETQYSEPVTFGKIYDEWYSRAQTKGRSTNISVTNGNIIETARGALTPIFGASSSHNFAEGLFRNYGDIELISSSEQNDIASNHSCKQHTI